MELAGQQGKSGPHWATDLLPEPACAAAEQSLVLIVTCDMSLRCSAVRCCAGDCSLQGCIQWPVFARPVAPLDWVFFGALPFWVQGSAQFAPARHSCLATRWRCWHLNCTALLHVAFVLRCPPAAGIRAAPPSRRWHSTASRRHSYSAVLERLAFELWRSSAAGIRAALSFRRWHSHCAVHPLLAFGLHCPPAAGIRPALLARCWHPRCAAQPLLAFLLCCAPAAGIRPALPARCWHWRRAARRLRASGRRLH
jgi:hypothetical protein